MKLKIETPKRYREYETIYILRPDVETLTAGKIADRINNVIEKTGGSLVKVENWGLRKLAYRVRKYPKGIYVYLRYIGDGSVVSELERHFRMQKDSVMKFMTVKLNDEVDPAKVEVDPEEIKFEEIQPASPEELEETREKQLGLAEMQPRTHASRQENEEQEAAEEAQDEAEAQEQGEQAEETAAEQEQAEQVDTDTEEEK